VKRACRPSTAGARPRRVERVIPPQVRRSARKTVVAASAVRAPLTAASTCVLASSRRAAPIRSVDRVERACAIRTNAILRRAGAIQRRAASSARKTAAVACAGLLPVTLARRTRARVLASALRARPIRSVCAARSAHERRASADRARARADPTASSAPPTAAVACARQVMRAWHLTRAAPMRGSAWASCLRAPPTASAAPATGVCATRTSATPRRAAATLRAERRCARPTAAVACAGLSRPTRAPALASSHRAARTRCVGLGGCADVTRRSAFLRRAAAMRRRASSSAPPTAAEASARPRRTLEPVLTRGSARTSTLRARAIRSAARAPRASNRRTRARRAPAAATRRLAASSARPTVAVDAACCDFTRQRQRPSQAAAFLFGRLTGFTSRWPRCSSVSRRTLSSGRCRSRPRRRFGGAGAVSGVRPAVQISAWLQPWHVTSAAA